MRTRKILMTISIAAVVLLAVMVFGQRIGHGSTGVTRIETRQGQQFDGALYALEPALYLAQGESICLLLEGDEIARAGGREFHEDLPPTSGKIPRIFETWETILPSGDLELRSAVRVRNDGTRVIEEVDWGFAPHEFDKLDGYRVLDGFGNDLQIRIEEVPSVPGKKVRVRLLRPVMPGEELRLTTISVDRGSIRRDGEDLVYRMEGDYPDPRLVSRTVRLPNGARIVSVRPEPIHQEAGEAPIVMWRRFFLQGERTPWEIRYRI